ncbi:hypothetical protein OVA30_22215 [Methylorubrum sp. SL192]|nr:hypothetical protein [Methylorubrum sp. SL192]MCY1644796.1 hypothetical protein [Methylorubrum sp. SL192]
MSLSLIIISSGRHDFWIGGGDGLDPHDGDASGFRLPDHVSGAPAAGKGDHEMRFAICEHSGVSDWTGTSAPSPVGNVAVEDYAAISRPSPRKSICTRSATLDDFVDALFCSTAIHLGVEPLPLSRGSLSLSLDAIIGDVVGDAAKHTTAADEDAGHEPALPFKRERAAR